MGSADRRFVALRALLSTVCLVIPCYNEAERLKRVWPRMRRSPCVLLFVNDGSTDATPEWLNAHVKPPHRVLHLAANAGKAEAVRQGMLFLRQEKSAKAFEW